MNKNKKYIRRSNARKGSKNKTRYVYTYTVMVLLTSILVCGAWFWNHPSLKSTWYPVRTVEIEGEFKHLSRVQLQKIATPIVTGGFFEIDLNAVRATLLEMSWIEDVSIRRTWPLQISIYVDEKKPVAYWGENALISEKGRVFLPDHEIDEDEMPRLDGPDGQHLALLEMLNQMQSLMNHLGFVITTLKLDERRSWRLSIDHRLELRLGRRNVMQRLQQFIAVFSNSAAPELKDISHIDMRYTNGFAVKWNSNQIASINTHSRGMS